MESPAGCKPVALGCVGSTPTHPTMNSRKQGSAGVGAAIAHFTQLGWPVFIPIAEVQRYDLVVEMPGRHGRLVRVECKTTTVTKSAGASYSVSLRTNGGNQSWNGLAKKFSSDDADYVFIMTPDGTYLIPAESLNGRSTVNVGNKYLEYQV